MPSLTLQMNKPVSICLILCSSSKVEALHTSFQPAAAPQRSFTSTDIVEQADSTPNTLEDGTRREGAPGSLCMSQPEHHMFHLSIDMSLDIPVLSGVKPQHFSFWPQPALPEPGVHQNCEG